MAIFCLATDLDDLKSRIGKIVIGTDFEGKEVTAKDLKADGAMTALLVDAFKPNLVQTLENNPAFVHGGPFANIAHGCNSVVATDLALKLGEWVVTEAGFASELGAEKFLNIKRKVLGKNPDVVVIVATVRALKHHGNGDLITGLDNLGAHIRNIKLNFGLPTIVCINKFKDDTQHDLDIVQSYANEDADDCVVSNHWAKGSDGALDLANSVINTAKVYGSRQSVYTYNDEDNYMTKISKVCKKIYGLKEVLFELQIQNKLLQWDREHPGLPICISKSPKTINPSTQGFEWLAGVELRAGAGFVVVKIGNVITLPGLPEVPSAEAIDVVDGKIVGIN